MISPLEDACIGVVNNSFVVELSENSNIVHTHKIVRGWNNMHMEHYGVNLAKKLNIPEPVLTKGTFLILRS